MAKLPEIFLNEEKRMASYVDNGLELCNNCAKCPALDYRLFDNKMVSISKGSFPFPIPKNLEGIFEYVSCPSGVVIGHRIEQYAIKNNDDYLAATAKSLKRNSTIQRNSVTTRRKLKSLKDVFDLTRPLEKITVNNIPIVVV